MENSNSRRSFIKKSTTLLFGALAYSAFKENALASEEQLEKSNVVFPLEQYTLPILPYTYEDLEPHIDKLTVNIHHSAHHQAYIINLNKALATIDNSLLESVKTLPLIFENIKKLPLVIRNNAGGHYNHSLYWSLMKPKGEGAPIGQLATAINASFGSFDEFKKQFADKSVKHFGSGWIWLIESKGKLLITSTPNQDNPLMKLDSIEFNGKPVLAFDVWEHAYYLKNENRRADYLTSWWNVVNWKEAEKLFIS